MIVRRFSAFCQMLSPYSCHMSHRSHAPHSELYSRKSDQRRNASPWALLRSPFPAATAFLSRSILPIICPLGTITALNEGFTASPELRFSVASSNPLPPTLQQRNVVTSSRFYSPNTLRIHEPDFLVQASLIIPPFYLMCLQVAQEER